MSNTFTIDDFNWSGCSENNKRILLFEHQSGTTLYETYFKVEPGDVVLDIGAHIGMFSAFIVDRHPSHLICIEPMPLQRQTLKFNLDTAHKRLQPPKKYTDQTTILDYAISDKYGVIELEFDGITELVTTKPFSDIIEEFTHAIDFMKIDCEGGEYFIFTADNIEFIKGVPKIACEFHLGHTHIGHCRERFRFVRDNIFPNFSNLSVIAIDGTDITWDLHSEEFLERYTEIIVFINNASEFIVN